VHERELRRLAKAALVLLDLLIPDQAQRLVVARQIEDALALPEGRAEITLLQALSRYMSVQLPEQVPLGTEFGVHVQITVDAPAGWHTDAIDLPDLPPEGATLTLTVQAPHLRPLDDLLQKVHVPAADDSTRVLFGFRAELPGLHDIVVSAYRAGTLVGEVLVRIAVEQGAAAQRRAG
jgi:hypothetical protein